jgi:predicted DNA-binding protein
VVPTIGDAIARMGVHARDGEELVVVKFRDGKPRNYLLRAVAEREISEQQDIYLASGAFRSGTISETAGRSKTNVARILFLPFDLDLTDFLAMPREQVYALPQDRIEQYLGFLLQEARERFSALGLPMHAIDYTGHGLLIRIHLAESGSDQIDEIQAAHKKLISTINAASGIQLVDPQASDAGTRISRLVPSLNGKGEHPRPTRSLHSEPGTITVDQLLAIAGQPRRQAPALLLPPHASRLPDNVASAIVQAVQPHWQEGSRHALALALAGILAKANVPEGQALEMVEALSGPDQEIHDRRATVATSYKRASAGLDTRGYHAMRDLLPESCVLFIDQELATIRQSGGGRIVLRAGETPAQPQADGSRAEGSITITPAPEICYRGWARSYVDLMLPTTEASPQFHLGVGLTMAGAVMGRRVAIQYGADPLYGNLYTLIVGRSGRTRKDTAIKRAIRMMSETYMLADGRAIRPPSAILTDIGSSEGLVAALVDHPQMLLYLTEFSKMMGNAKRKATSTIIPTLIEAYDTPPKMAIVTKGNPLAADYPYVSILSATQPQILAGLMANDDIHSGFANRIFYVIGPQTDPIPEPPEVDALGARSVWMSLWEAVEWYPSGTRLRMDDRAREIWREWYIADYRSESESEEEDAMRVRHAVLIQKLALIYAVTERAKEVTAEHLEAAIALVQWMWAHVSQLMGDWGTPLDSQIEARILAQLHRHGPMRRRELQMRCGSKRWSGRDFAMTFKAMQENGALAVDAIGMVGIPE